MSGNASPQSVNDPEPVRRNGVELKLGSTSVNGRTLSLSQLFSRTSGSMALVAATFLLLPSCGKDVRPRSVASKRTDSARSGVPYETRLASIDEPAGVALSSGSSAETIPCGTCHKGRDPQLTLSHSDDLNEFHQDLTYAHSVTCVSCHAPGGYDDLRLADGTRLGFTESQRLCSQCHGTQKRDYDNGAHGGWNGYWDLSQGPRVRNQCTHCHDPHAPAYPRMQPTFKPKDRFLEPKEHGGESASSSKHASLGQFDSSAKSGAH